jgi:hypothetical protein
MGLLAAFQIIFASSSVTEDLSFNDGMFTTGKLLDIGIILCNDLSKLLQFFKFHLNVSYLTHVGPGGAAVQNATDWVNRCIGTNSVFSFLISFPS